MFSTKYRFNLFCIICIICIIFFFSIFLNTKVHGVQLPTQQTGQHISGKILLISFPCYLCQLIEREQTIYPYSHIAMELFNPDHPTQPLWIEAWGQDGVVIKTEKEFFDSLKQRKAKISTSKNFLFNLSLLPFFKQDQIATWNKFLWESAQHYLYASYDKQFLWYNVDRLNREKLYCSELVVKVLNKTLRKWGARHQLTGKQLQTLLLAPKPMSYLKAWQYWERYFAPNPIPQGEPGITPEAVVLSRYYAQ